MTADTRRLIRRANNLSRLVDAGGGRKPYMEFSRIVDVILPRRGVVVSDHVRCPLNLP